MGRFKLDIFATRRMWARFILDQSSTVYPGDSDSNGTGLSTEALLAWEHSPGRAVYLGAILDEDDGDWGALTWQVFAKATWMFSL